MYQDKQGNVTTEDMAREALRAAIAKHSRTIRQQSNAVQRMRLESMYDVDDTNSYIASNYNMREVYYA